MIEVTKVELTKYGGLSIAYIEGEDEPIEIKCKSMAAPHPDFMNLLDNLKPYVSKCYGMDESKIKVLGVDYSGLSVILKFAYLTKNNSEVKLVTPRIKFEGEAFGFEAELSAVTDAVAYETNEYLNGKRAQMELFNVCD